MAKLQCAICQTHITLAMGRYPTKDKNKICKTCTKKAGLNALTVQSFTVEEIIANSQSPQNDKIEKIMQQLADAGISGTFGTKKEIKHLPDVIHDDEIIKYATSGFYSGSTVLIVVTDKRIIFFDKGLIYGTNKTEIPLDKINSISYKKGMVLSKLKMYNGAAPVNIDKIENNTIEKLTSILNKSIEDYNNKPQQVVSAHSVADELKKFKELLDSEIISQEEFDDQKKKLLGL